MLGLLFAAATPAAAQAHFTITASAGSNGSITPVGAITVANNASQAFAITPIACYRVADVKVDGVSVGAVASYSFSNVTANHTIAATFTAITYTLTARATGNGTITPSGAMVVKCGTNKTFTMTPAAGHRVADVKVDGVSVGALATYKFTAIDNDHTIEATFVPITFTLTASSTGNGTLSPTGVTTVGIGTDQTFTMTPVACNRIKDVKVDGVSVGALASYAFTNVTANHTIAATFVVEVDTLTASAGAGGTITPTGVVPVGCGTNKTFTITPTSGYRIADVKVDGVSVGAVATYKFSAINGNHTIAATFVSLAYTITATAGTGGTITPSGAVSAAYLSDPAFTIAPAACKRIVDVKVDGVSVGAVSSYTFTDVAANHTIAATFATESYTLVASAGAAGTITPTGSIVVNCGTNKTFTITPAAGNRIWDVKVDGVSVGAVNRYTFTGLTAGHTIAASFIPTSAQKLVSLRADRANGSGPYSSPGAAGPWVDLAGDHDATLFNFTGNLTSGWRGNGTPQSPYGLEFGNYDKNAINHVDIPAGSVPELQTPGPVTAEVWFKTGYNAPSDHYDYVLEWVQPPGVPYNAWDEGLGMSIAVIENGKIAAYFNPWVEIADAEPNTWYHVIVSKDTSEVRVYLNGVKKHSGSWTHSGAQISPIVIGGSIFRLFEGHTGDDAYRDLFSGRVGQVEIWRGALTDAQAKQEFQADSALYIAPPASSAAQRVVWFDADQADGSAPYASPGAAGPWVDLESPRNDGVLKNFAGTLQSGWMGDGSLASPRRLEFDGSDDVVAVPAGSVAELMNASAISVEIRFLTGNSNVDDFQFVAQWLQGVGNTPGFDLATHAGKLAVYLGWDLGWVDVADVAQHTWYHAVVVKKPGNIKIFLDGAQVYSGGRPNFGVPATEIVLGASTWRGVGQYGEYWPGAISEFAVWNGALTDSEVTALFASSSPQVVAGSAAAGAAGTPVAAFAAPGSDGNTGGPVVQVVFSLPNADASRIELLDANGIRVAASEVASLGRGRRAVPLGEARALPAGTYWVRLTQGTRTHTRKAVLPDGGTIAVSARSARSAVRPETSEVERPLE